MRSTYWLICTCISSLSWTLLVPVIALSRSLHWTSIEVSLANERTWITSISLFFGRHESFYHFSTSIGSFSLSFLSPVGTYGCLYLFISFVVPSGPRTTINIDHILHVEHKTINIGSLIMLNIVDQKPRLT